MRKRIAEMLILVSFMTVFIVTNRNTQTEVENVNQVQIIDTQIVEKYNYLSHTTFDIEQEEIRNEIMYGEIDLLAQLVEAESGNQDETGKRYVADVVLNRVESDKFPDTIEEVIYQLDPPQFACVIDGNYARASWTVTQEDFTVALEEYSGKRLNTEIHYFRTEHYGSGIPAFRYGSHYFSK